MAPKPTKRMQATARRLSVVSATSFARRRLIRDVAASAGDQRRRGDQTFNAFPLKVPLQDEPGGPGLVAKAQFDVRMGLAQLGKKLVDAVQIAADAAVMAHLGSGFCNGDGDVLGMDIQPDMDY
jgi:hypothetical protein